MKESEAEKVKLCEREGLKACLYNGGGLGKFTGQVELIDGNKYLFKRIWISYTALNGNMEDNKEDHLWIMNGEAFVSHNIEVGDYVSFYGEVILYKRKNGTYELSVAEPYDIEKVKDYELPSDDFWVEQFIRELVCEVCPCQFTCYGSCINEDWAAGHYEYLMKVNEIFDKIFDKKYKG